MPNATARLTLEQIHYLVPHEKREGKYQCPRCHKWHLEIDEKTDDLNCWSPECQGKVHEIVALLRAEVKRRKTKPAQSDAPPSGSGMTLVEYAREKMLSPEFLRNHFGVYDGPHPYYSPALKSAVAFPYYNEEGKEVTTQWRWGMDGGQRKFLKGTHTYLYGGRFLQLLEQQAAKNESPQMIFIVEGESNTQTLAYLGRPAVGCPGGAGWKKEWAQLGCLQKAEFIFVLQDPDATGEGFARKVAECFPPGKVLAVKLPDVKDVSDLWRYNSQFGDGQRSFNQELDSALIKAKPIIRPAEPKVGQPSLEVNLVRADQVEMKLEKWLWQDRIPLGHLTLFYGLPDEGKSVVAIDIIARGSRGDAMPDAGAVIPPFESIVFATEDDPHTIYVPRLVAAGAELQMVYLEQGIKIPSDAKQAQRRIALKLHLEAIERVLAEHPGVRLLVMDPISSYLGDLNRNKDADVRPLLDDLVALAQKHGIAVLALTHFNKNSEQAAIHRISGAGAWGEAPRVAWGFVHKPLEDEEEAPNGQSSVRERLMLVGKLNIVSDSKKNGLRYVFEDVCVPIEGQQVIKPRVKWLGPSSETMTEVLAAERVTIGRPGPKPQKREEAGQWLKTFLTLEPKLSNEILEAGAQEGYSKNTLHRAKKVLGVISLKKSDEWYWRLPDVDNADPNFALPFSGHGSW